MTGNSAERLRQTVSAVAGRLRALSDADASVKPSPTRWSKKEILGHLIDSASNNHQRFVRALLHGELRFPAYEQEGWARCQDYQAADEVQQPDEEALHGFLPASLERRVRHL